MARNIAVGLAKLGAAPLLVSAVGADGLGEEILRGLAEVGESTGAPRLAEKVARCRRTQHGASTPPLHCCSTHLVGQLVPLLLMGSSVGPADQSCQRSGRRGRH